VSLYFTALEKIALTHADDDGRIPFPKHPAPDVEIFLEVLLNLEARGYLVREPGIIPMLPFHLSPLGRVIRNALSGPHDGVADAKANTR